MLFADGIRRNASVLMGALKKNMLLGCVHVHNYTCNIVCTKSTDC